MGNTATTTTTTTTLQSPGAPSASPISMFYSSLLDEFGSDLERMFVDAGTDVDGARAEVADDDTALCAQALRDEPRLAALRYRIVPSRVSESKFWTVFLQRYREYVACTQDNAGLVPEQSTTTTRPAAAAPTKPPASPVRKPHEQQFVDEYDLSGVVVDSPDVDI
ncbi:BSD domain-containing protein [Plasmodiophora brassicae]